jgi:hypothetical protein
MHNPIVAHWRFSSAVLEHALRWVPHVAGSIGAVFVVLVAADSWSAPLWRSGAPLKAFGAAGIGLLGAVLAYSLGWLSTFLVLFALYAVTAQLDDRG